ncbi:hypothetical protein Deipe_1456 [Deinococcus peraridilitoris DSM 19664]|uniref:Uncharacterized protein n=2 Tax=Deinococcus TaxID=1298 RepID=L0A1E0_DEIPD|nr:hypothetical protein Deipe_1456 [Deinococcus peraridilitoris DSM 19664]
MRFEPRLQITSHHSEERPRLVKGMSSFVQMMAEFEDPAHPIAKAREALLGPPYQGEAGREVVIDTTLRRIVHALLEGKLDNPHLFTKVRDALVDRAVGERPTFITTSWITGVYLMEESYGLEPGVVLRRITAEDIAADLRILGERNSPLRDYPSAVLDIHKKYPSADAYQEDAVRMLQTLSLIGTGSVEAVMTIAENYVPFNNVHTSWSTESWKVDQGFEFSSKHLELFRVLREPVLAVIDSGKPSGSRDTWTGYPEIDIALSRYHESFKVDTITDAKIARLVGALEALFGENKPELKRRLCQRAALLLSLEGVEPIEASTMLAKCYDNRSTYVHGGLLSAKKRAEAENHLPILLQFTRVLILLSLLLKKSNSRKDNLMGLLDRALLSLPHRNLLLQLHQESVPIPLIKS